MVPTPFRNFLKKPAAPNGGVIDSNDGNRLSAESHRSTPLSIRKSCENEPPEYKLSGMPFALSDGTCCLIPSPTCSVVDDNGAYLPVYSSLPGQVYPGDRAHDQNQANNRGRHSAITTGENESLAQIPWIFTIIKQSPQSSR